jgi:hypothetical protein
MLRLARRSGMQVEHIPASNLAIAHMRPRDRSEAPAALGQ